MISINEIYEQDINFLFGSGASSGLFPTLQLGVQRDDGTSWTLEELATHFEETDDPRKIPLFMHYYASCIKPAEDFRISTESASEQKSSVIKNYRDFLETILTLLQRRNALDKRCNLFTTNYDGCFPLVADEIIRQGNIDFILNDGTRGFSKMFLQASNFNTFLCQTGVFGRHQSSIPQINLIHLHGSVYWKVTEGCIEVDYHESKREPLLSESELNRLAPFSAALMNSQATLPDAKCPTLTKEELEIFWINYKKKPIVNPTKWKFHETVFDEHYYQMLRLLSYELEKPNAVLITFGFSFADEHILNLVRRSLSNPGLQLFICCYNQLSYQSLATMFRGKRNVKCLMLDEGNMNFSAFNEKVLVGPNKSNPIIVESKRASIIKDGDIAGAQPLSTKEQQ